ncbi:MAG: hypothetical protein WBP79_17065 [Candidatus Acidiferrales bacterium]
MDIIWTALGICVVVVFVFYVLAQHWQRILRHQSWTIRRLTERLQNLEDVADPDFVRRLNESAPSPLEQVFTFSFRIDDSFWRDTLHATEEDLKFIRTIGSFLGSVKIERWRGHTVATITEVLPESKSAGWQTRTLDLYSGGTERGDALTLWELPLARPQGPAQRPPSLELLLHENSLELRGQLYSSASGNGHRSESGPEEIVYFRVPLEATQLAGYRSHDPLQDAENGNGDSNAGGIPVNGTCWHAFYSHQDENIGLEWQLWFRDLCKKAEWERWRILESAPVSVLEEQK